MLLFLPDQPLRVLLIRVSGPAFNAVMTCTWTRSTLPRVPWLHCNISSILEPELKSGSAMQGLNIAPALISISPVRTVIN